MALRQRRLAGSYARKPQVARSSSGGGGGGYSSPQITPTNYVDIASKQYISALPGGEITTSAQAAELEAILAAIPDEVDAEGVKTERVLDMRITKKKLEGAELANQNRGFGFDESVQYQRDDIINAYLDNPGVMANELGTLYSNAADYWEESFTAQGKTMEGDDLKYYQTLKEKGRKASEFAEAAIPNFLNPTGAIDPNAWVAQIDTDASGNMTDINFIPSGELGTKNGYMRVNQELGVGENGIKIALKGNPSASEAYKDSTGKILTPLVARFNGIDYKGFPVTDSGVAKELADNWVKDGYGAGYLKAQVSPDGGSLFGQGDPTTKAKNDFVSRTSTDGGQGARINLKEAGVTYSAHSVSPGQEVKVGNELYYSNPRTGALYKIAGNTIAEKEQTLRNYYKATGLPETAQRVERRPAAVLNIDGTSKAKATIDQNWLTPQAPGPRESMTGLPSDLDSLEGQSMVFRDTSGKTGPINVGAYKAGRIAQNASETEAGAKVKAAGGALAGFLQNKNAPNKPNVQEFNRESSGGQLNAGSILNKGLDIFSGKTGIQP